MDHTCDFLLMVENFMEGTPTMEVFVDGFIATHCIFPWFFLSTLY
jgi:hypothetical protein